MRTASAAMVSSRRIPESEIGAGPFLRNSASSSSALARIPVKGLLSSWRRISPKASPCASTGSSMAETVLGRDLCRQCGHGEGSGLPKCQLDFFREFLKAKRFGDVRQPVRSEEFLGCKGQYIAGDKKEFRA